MWACFSVNLGAGLEKGADAPYTPEAPVFTVRVVLTCADELTQLADHQATDVVIQALTKESTLDIGTVTLTWK